uniref:NAD(P)-binding domain-containing protein n=1 Tax=Setaria digitata TaxID=48799 RepID=A0A915Q007_9BILA
MHSTSDKANYLFIGGLSYIGLYTVEYLLVKYPKANLTVLDLLVDNTNYTADILKKFENYSERCAVITGSCSNNELVKKILKERKINIVLYNVWSVPVAVIAARQDYPECFRKTLSCLTQFLETLRCNEQLTKFILISSEEVYGKQISKLETTATKPSSLKGATLAACETMLHSYIISYRIPALIVRLSAVLYGGVMDDNPLLYCEQDNNAKGASVGLLHIQDAVNGIGAALEKGQTGEIYNIGGQCDCPPLFTQLIAKLKKDEILNDEISILPLTMSSVKAEQDLHWKAEISPLEGIRQPKTGTQNQCNKTSTTTMYKILFYGTEFSLKRLNRLIKDKAIHLPEPLQKENIIITKRSFSSNDVDISEIIDIAPSHIVYINLPNSSEVFTNVPHVDIDARTLLKTKIYAMLYAPWLLASFCRKCSIHFTYLTSHNPLDEKFFIEPCLEEKMPSEHMSSFEHVMAIDKFTDRLMQHFESILFCRISLVSKEENKSEKKTVLFLMIPRLCFGLEGSFYLSLLSGCIPQILSLVLKGRIGTVDVSSPIPLCDHDFRDLFNRGTELLGASIEFFPKEKADFEIYGCSRDGITLSKCAK